MSGATKVLGQAIKNAKNVVAGDVGKASGKVLKRGKGQYIDSMGETGFWGRVGAVGKQMGSNIMKEGGDGGWGVAKMIGKSALKGSVLGAAVGGTSEWAQGGSFWTGAKSGAFNGAVLGGAYKGLRAGTGAKTLNPFKREGAFGKTFDMYGGKVSKQVQAIQRPKSSQRVAQQMVGGGF